MNGADPYMAADRCSRPLPGSGAITGIGKRCFPSVSEVSGTTSTVCAVSELLC
jgi:hypothetical protein